MKDNSQILSLQETEELCRLYLECRLSLLEERELQYVLSKMSYSSPVIDETRESMAAEGLLLTLNTDSHRNRRSGTVRRWLRWSAGIAASVTVLFAVSLFITGRGETGAEGKESIATLGTGLSKGEPGIVIAYEGGRRLSSADSEKSVEKAIEKAERLMAMAEAKEREEISKQNHIMHLISEK